MACSEVFHVLTFTEQQKDYITNTGNLMTDIVTFGVKPDCKKSYC